MSLSAMQAAAALPPAAPSAPQAPAPGSTRPGVAAAAPGPGGTTQKLTLADVRALRARKNELSNQLESADSRRREVQHALRGAQGADKAGLEQRLAVLDARIARLESDIDENSSQLASLETTHLTTMVPGTQWSAQGPRWPDSPRDDEMPIPVALILGFLAAVALGALRRFFRRPARPASGAPLPDTTGRLERMEQAIEAIAIEIERVSEGQRFVTRLMSEKAGGLAPGQAPLEPVPVGERQVVERR